MIGSSPTVEPSATATPAPRTVAVIDIGATSVRMAIAEIQADGDVRQLETLVQAVDLGRDVFDDRRLSRKNIEKTAAILQRYQRLLHEYGIDGPDSVRIVATSAIREALNSLAFADRVFIATGLNVDLIDEAEVNRITYMGLMPQLAQSRELTDGKVIAIEVGGGTTEMLMLRSGNVLHSQSYRFGSLRIVKALDRVPSGYPRWRSMLEGHLRRTLRQIGDAVRTNTPIHLMAMGGDMRFAVRQLVSDWDGHSLVQVRTADVLAIAEEILKLDVDRVVRRFGATFVEAETLGPALLIYARLAEQFGVEQITVCETNLRDGLLRDMAEGGSWTSDFRNQIVRSTLSLGRKFSFDETHARNVAELSRQLFENLRDIHGLEDRHEVLLFVAALLHEIGYVVNVRGNHKHALYLIRHSEIFGLSRAELLVVGLIVRYHRRANPQPRHEVYASLPQEQRVLVAKLAAVLRLAIALDDPRGGRVREIQCVAEGRNVMIDVVGVEDVSLEHIAIRESGGLFREVFGFEPFVRPGRR